jgi:FkbM family methyltransferase
MDTIINLEQVLQDNKVFVQIGTYDGKDLFNDLVRAKSPSLVLLIEPNSSMNAKIQENYIGVNNIVIKNCAITDQCYDTVKLVIPTSDTEKTGENGVAYDYCNFTLLPMDDWGDRFIEITAPSMTFNELCSKYNITHIHFLQIDTEGYDYEIIKSIDFNNVRIDVLQYEKWMFNEDYYNRYGDKRFEYGINGMRYVENMLNSIGYNIYPLLNEDVDKGNNCIAIHKTFYIPQ